MARGKKKEELTLEEKLERALVPVDEQPYEVPKNWCWVRIGSISQVVSGGTPTTSNKEFYVNGNVPWISPADLSGYKNKYISCGAKMITRLGLEKSSARLLPRNTVCLSTRAPIGYVVIAETELSTNQGFKNFCPSPGFMPEYLYWYLKGNKELLEEKASGTTFLELSGNKAAKIEFALPPLEEQKRIVEQIESLFAKLDEAKEKVQEVLNGYEIRKASILQKAFKGELTIQWRQDNNIDMDTWEDKQLDEVCKSVFDGDHMPPPKSESGVHFLVISNVNQGYLSFENTRYVSQEYYNNLTETRKPEVGDILYTLVGSYGIPIVVDSDIPFCFQRHMGLLKLNKINTFFLWYQMQSNEFYNKVSKIANGTAQLTVPIKGLRKIKVSCPSEGEQKEIVRILDNLLKKNNEIKQIAKSVLNKISLLQKSILAKAFRGELGTNNQKEESSMELLKKIMAKVYLFDKTQDRDNLHWKADLEWDQFRNALEIQGNDLRSGKV